jgi:hypothetical protein
MNRKNFKASDNIEKYIAMTNGHTFRIGAEWVLIPEFAWQACYAAGCISEDILKGMMADLQAAPEVQKRINKDSDIRSILKGWIEENKLENFNTNGTPKINPLNEELGWRADRAVVNRIWFEIQENK